MQKRFLAAVVAVLTLGLLAPCAYAWGPKAQEAISSTSIKYIRRTVPEAFRIDKNSGYEMDVVRGAADGIAALGTNVSIGNRRQAIDSVANEIVLLRETRTFGTGSYFAYRMGALSALVSEILMPYAFDPSPESMEMLRRIDEDIDEHFGKFQLGGDPSNVEAIRLPRDYFAKRFRKYEDARTLIASDYRLGKGYEGYLKQASKSMFEGALQAVNDVWFTVFQTSTATDGLAPSKQSVTWYLVSEIEYQLKHKKNMGEAEKVYNTFTRNNVGILAAHERIGDLFYGFGEFDRGVQEWMKALDYSGPERSRVTKKLSNHFLNKGKMLMAAARTPENADQALTDAEISFQRALEVDSGNSEAAELLDQTKSAIRDRQQQREFVINLLAGADKLQREAQANELAAVYSQALELYTKAGDTYRNPIVQEFPDLATAGTKGAQDMDSKVLELMGQLIEKANVAIEEGDALVDSQQFDLAMERYRSVQSYLIPIPEDDPSNGAKRAELLQKAKDQQELAELEKTRFQERQQQQGSRPAGAAAAPAAPAATRNRT